MHTSRVFKQTLRAAGGNLTEKHVEEVSLSVLFLMDAAKKFDKAMGASPQTTTHTVRDATADIKKMVTYLRENNVSQLVENRASPSFSDPTNEGYKKLCSSWLKETLSRTHVSYNSPPSDEGDYASSELCGRERMNEEIELDYELCDIPL